MGISLKITAVLILLQGVFNSLFAQNTFSVSGKVHGLENNQAFLYQQESGSRKLINSTSVIDGKFSFTRQINEPHFYSIKFDSVPGVIQFIWDNNISISGQADSVWVSTVSGSEETQLSLDFEEKHLDPLRRRLIKITNQMQEARELNDTLTIEKLQRVRKFETESARLLTFSFIEQHPTSYLSLFFLNNQAKQIGPFKTQEILKTLAPALSNHSEYKNLSQWADNKLKAGVIAPQFATTTLEGDSISLSDLKGSYVVLDFWGTWCGPCIASIPDLRNVYQKFKDKNFRLVSVACEREEGSEAKSKVAKFAKKEKMDWTHIVESFSSKFDSSSLISQFTVDSFPTLVLIDPAGYVLFVGTGSDEVPQLEKVLEQQLM